MKGILVISVFLFVTVCCEPPNDVIEEEKTISSNGNDTNVTKTENYLNELRNDVNTTDVNVTVLTTIKEEEEEEEETHFTTTVEEVTEVNFTTTTEESENVTFSTKSSSDIVDKNQSVIHSTEQKKTSVLYTTEEVTLPKDTTNSTNPCLNCTTPTTTPINNVPTSDTDVPNSALFNLNYLYFLLLLIPIIGIPICGYCYCKRRRKRDGYFEPGVQKTKRLSTPSWVFSEPDFHDEEIMSLEEQKKP